MFLTIVVGIVFSFLQAIHKGGGHVPLGWVRGAFSPPLGGMRGAFCCTLNEPISLHTAATLNVRAVTYDATP